MRTLHDGIRLTYNPKTGKMEKVEGFSFLGITHVTMPWNWFEICASLPRSETVFPVAGLICLQKDLKRSQRITLPRTALSRCGITGQALSRALAILQEAGLIEVIHKPGQKSEIVVVDPQGTAAMAKREQQLKLVINNDEWEGEP
jgi:hypothetical protein